MPKVTFRGNEEWKPAAFAVRTGMDGNVVIRYDMNVSGYISFFIIFILILKQESEI